MKRCPISKVKYTTSNPTIQEGEYIYFPNEIHLGIYKMITSEEYYRNCSVNTIEEKIVQKITISDDDWKEYWEDVEFLTTMDNTNEYNWWLWKEEHYMEFLKRIN